VHMLLMMKGSHSDEDGAIELEDWGKDEKRMNKLCFIGRNLDREEIISGLKACIFDGKCPEPGEPPATELRFAVGDRVKVNLGGWEVGTVKALWYREALWETGRFVPYQVQCDEGSLVWTPRDTNAFVRALK
jgi:hypothetical protein